MKSHSEISGRPGDEDLRAGVGREVWLDWLRVAACFMVMVVHATEPFYLGGEGSLILTKADAFWAAFFLRNSSKGSTGSGIAGPPAFVFRAASVSSGRGFCSLPLDYGAFHR